MYQDIIDNTNMNIDFLDFQTKSLEELRELINTYQETYQNYKSRLVCIPKEMINLFGNIEDLIYLPTEYPWERKKYNNILWKEYKIRFYSNFDDAVKLKEKKQKEKRKEQIKQYNKEKAKEKIKEYNNQKRDCEICGGKFYIKHKAKHLRTKKHHQGLEIEKNKEQIEVVS